MDRFDAMQAFARVVETGSFTKAAETLHMSRTSVTQLVQQLEARLRVRLLNRTTRKLNLTADGAAYYERVVRLLAELDDAETSLSSAALAPRGRLRIDVPSPLARLLLIPALPEFHARYPEIQIDLGVSDRLVDLIDENVDCVIRGGELRDQSLMARRVGDLQLGVYAAPAYLQRAGVPSHPRELEDSHQRIVGFLWARTGKALPYAMHRARKACGWRAAMCWRWTTATPTWRPGWPAWASSGCRTTWRVSPSPAASCCRCSRTGAWSRCRCTWRSRRTATSAASCGCSSSGSPN